MGRGVLVACLGSAFSLSAPPVLASPPFQTPDNPADLTQLSLEQLANLRITSVSKRPESLARTAAAAYVITSEDIRRSGATSIPEILRLAPGVEVTRIDSDHWAVGIRGLGSQYSRSVLVLIDGRSVYSPLLAGVIWGVQDTLLEDIDRIEVIRGPGGTIWGATAVNGVINIITKSTRATNGMLASATAGNVDKGLAELRYGAAGGEAFSYRAYGKLFTRAEMFHPDGQTFDRWRMGQAGLRAEWAVKEGDRLTLQSDAYTGEQGQSLSLATFSPPAQTAVNDPLDVSGGNVRMAWRHELKEDADIQVQAYWDRTHLRGPQLEETRDTLDIDFIAHLTLPGHQSFVGGFGGRSSPSHFVQTIPTVDFVPRDQNGRLYSVFLQDEIPLAQDHLSVTFGSKFEHNDYTGWEVQPSGRLSWSLSQHHALWAAVTRAVRTPSEVEESFRDTGLLGLSPLAFGEIDGNSALVSERLLAYEGGYRARVGARVSLDLAVFHNQYDDLVNFGDVSFTADPSPAPPHFTLHVPYANGIRGAVDGFEIVPDWKPTDWFRLKGSYSFLSFALRAKAGHADVAGVVASDEGSSPRHEVTIQSLVDLPGHLEIDSTFRFVSALPAQTVKSYETVDVRIGWRPTRALEMSLVGQNLLQPHHAEFAGNPGPIVSIRRAVYANVTWRK